MPTAPPEFFFSIVPTGREVVVMASKKKAKRTRRSATRSRSALSLKAGDRVQEGTIVEVHAGAALIGREPANADEQPAPGETVLFVQNRRVFLAAGQVFIPL